MAATIDDLLNELRLAREGQETSNDEARKQAERERRLLGQSEKQYEEMLEQRKRTEESKKQMDELESILGEDAKNNKVTINKAVYRYGLESKTHKTQNCILQNMGHTGY